MRVALIGRGTESLWIEVCSDTHMENHKRHGWVVLWEGVL